MKKVYYVSETANPSFMNQFWYWLDCRLAYWYVKTQENYLLLFSVIFFIIFLGRPQSIREFSEFFRITFITIFFFFSIWFLYDFIFSMIRNFKNRKMRFSEKRYFFDEQYVYYPFSYLKFESRRITRVRVEYDVVFIYFTSLNNFEMCLELPTYLLNNFEEDLAFLTEEQLNNSIKARDEAEKKDAQLFLKLLPFSILLIVLFWRI